MMYLLHFSKKYHDRVQHYLGYCNENGLSARMDRHRSGNGAKLMRAIVKAGINFDIVKIWPDGTRDFERRIKNCKNHKRYCPLCQRINHVNGNNSVAENNGS